MSGDPSDLTSAMWTALLTFAGEHQPVRAHRNPLSAGTVRALVIRRLIEWEYAEERAGWRLTDKGQFVVEWKRAQSSTGGTDR